MLRADGRVEQIAGQAEVGTVEIQGVGAGPFDAELWEQGTLHFVPDVRSPMIRPRLSGVFRNIYAPSPVEVAGGWRLFYGAWDGVPTGNDRIYSVFTRDFLDFDDRRIEIEHGKFIHVCNVNAFRMADGSYRLICTAYPDANGKNKPAFFGSPDGKTWNGSPAPYEAQPDDIVTIDGYAPYTEADINGINVLLPEDDQYRLYFGNFTQHGHVHRATSKDGKHYQYEGVCLDTGHMVNDVRPLLHAGKKVYLMGLHANGDRLWYSLSRDGMKFGPEHEMARSLGAEDRFMVAIGWVLRDNRVLGFVYGAGAVKELNRNRLFGRWLQKKVVFTAADGTRVEASGSLGPDRAILPVAGTSPIQGQLAIFREDGKTPLGTPVPVKLISGAVYRIAE
jgi:hypothetical protein